MKFEDDSIEGSANERLVSKMQIPDDILWEKINSKLIESDKRSIKLQYLTYLATLFTVFSISLVCILKFMNISDTQNQLTNYNGLRVNKSGVKKYCKSIQFVSLSMINKPLDIYNSRDLSSMSNLNQLNGGVSRVKSLNYRSSIMDLKIVKKIIGQEIKNSQLVNSVNVRNESILKADFEDSTNQLKFVESIFEEFSPKTSPQPHFNNENSTEIGRLKLLKPFLTVKENEFKLVEKYPNRTTLNSGKFYLGINLTPSLSNRIITNTGNSAQHYNSLLENERGIFNTNYGISFGYRINNHFSLKTGLQNLKFSTVYSLNNASVFYDTLINQYSFQTTFGELVLHEDDLNYQDIDNPNESGLNAEDTSVVELSYTNKNTIQFLQVPLVFEYGFNIQRFRFFVSSGLTLGRIVNAYSVIETHGLASNKNNMSPKLNKWLYGGEIELGCEYFLSNHFSLTASPSVNYSFNFMNKSQDVKIKPYWLGVNASLRYYF